MAKQEMAWPDLVSCGATEDLKSKFYQITQKYEHKIGERKPLHIFNAFSNYLCMFECVHKLGQRSKIDEKSIMSIACTGE